MGFINPAEDKILGQPLEGVEKEEFERKVKKYSALLQQAQEIVGQSVFGQEKFISDIFTCIAAGGHILTEGNPGLAKTLTINKISEVLGLSFKRIQFTPDLMPADITGMEVLDENEEGKKYLRFIRGPIFNRMILADEINRTPPKTQSALLEAMQEKQVTAAGETRKLEEPFFVMATQNAVESDGTYDLPEAQLDRFMMKLVVDYPDEESEMRIAVETTGPKPKKDFNKVALFTPEDLIDLQDTVRRMNLPESVVRAAVRIVRDSRPVKGREPRNELEKFVKDTVKFGPGPRAIQNFMWAAKARALMRGDTIPRVDDVLKTVEPVMRHRMGFKYANQNTKEEAFQELVQRVTADYALKR